ncbi:hypothetical protein BH09SUM1_BH09SUM1_01180 [soil metagenome]
MSIFIAEELRREARSFYNLTLTESLNLKTASKDAAPDIVRATGKDPDPTVYDIFLSHSFLDQAVIAGLKVHFDKMGHKTYVDWLCDPQLSRGSVGKATSERLKMRMRNSLTLFYAFSSNAKGSKWMPWELGFMDAEKDRCAVLRVEAEGGTFSYRGFEYLEIYPYVEEAQTKGGKDAPWIQESDKVYAPFEDWKSGVNPWRHP